VIAVPWIIGSTRGMAVHHVTAIKDIPEQEQDAILKLDNVCVYLV